MLFSHDFEFALDHSLVANEGPIEIVGKRHVAPCLPIADGLSFTEFASKGGFRPHVKPESQMRPKGHGVEAPNIIAIDAAHDATADQRENVAIREHYGSG